MTNIVVLRGRVSRPPTERELPSGDRIAAFDMTVPGGVTGTTSPRSESVPLAWFEPPAWVASLAPGTEVLVAGRVRRRFYRPPAGGLQSRTEVVVDQAAPVRNVAKCVALLRRVTDQIAGADPAEPAPGEGGPQQRPARRRK